MNMCNVKGNFFVNGENFENRGEYSEKIRDQFKYGLDLFNLKNIEEYYVQNGTYVEPVNYHPMNDGRIFLPTRNFDLKENNSYFEDLAILAYITSFVSNTKDIDDLSFIKTKSMLDQSGAEVIYRTIPMKILIKVLEDIVGEEKITFDFEKIKTYDPSKRNSVYFSTMSQNTISIQEIYRVLNYIQETPDACEFLLYCYTRLDEYHKKFLMEISESEVSEKIVECVESFRPRPDLFAESKKFLDTKFAWIKYNPFTDELYILKSYNDVVPPYPIKFFAERIKQRLIRFINSKNVFRMNLYAYLEYIKKFIPYDDQINPGSLHFVTKIMPLILQNLKASKVDLCELGDSGSEDQNWKELAEDLIILFNYSKREYDTDKFEVGFDKFNNLKIKLYKV